MLFMIVLKRKQKKEVKILLIILKLEKKFELLSKKLNE